MNFLLCCVCFMQHINNIKYQHQTHNNFVKHFKKIKKRSWRRRKKYIFLKQTDKELLKMKGGEKFSFHYVIWICNFFKTKWKQIEGEKLIKLSNYSIQVGVERNCSIKSSSSDPFRVWISDWSSTQFLQNLV